MSNSEGAGNESSSSNPTEESPRHRGQGQGQGRGGSSPLHPWEMALFSPPRPRAPPVMGAPGRTAFGPYRPLPPQTQWPLPLPLPLPLPGPGPSHHGSRPLGFQAFPIEGGGGGGVAVGGGIRIGGSPSSSSGRKRGREVGGGNNRAAGEGGVHHCSVCNKGFGSSKALFGHMRSHPDRGWKGVHPPPAFRAEEEFADLHVAPEADAEAEPEPQDGVNYKLPDLNHPPPPDSK